MSKEERPWSIDLNLREQDVGYSLLQNCPPPLGMKKVQSLERQYEAENSHGSAGTTGDKSNKAKSIVAKKQAKAMSIATSPGKQILMNGFMMYMSGKTLNIFSISITSMAVMNPIMSILSVNNTFKVFEDPDGKVDLQMPKMIFMALNLVWLFVGLYKMSSMRLLPTTSADWSGTVVWKELMEISSIPPL
uniref:ER membrane protein complex subunit 4 n=1 Tax=Trieres chinensis TaxID=1514140 RepID=A0A7S1YWL0_TRICV|mmetsp:Transcript_12054/g.25127  ORF Transcript_12054/g.25127 Transcript_12054/m.25127 type:complete len:190 (+) Transcript_12054:137-706(+)